jgi:IMP and pyridine-specific 5'-nucleotidase
MYQYPVALRGAFRRIGIKTCILIVECTPSFVLTEILFLPCLCNRIVVLDAPQTYEDSFIFFEELINECLADPVRCRLKKYVPSVSKFFTPLNLRDAWLKYDSKYAVSERRHLAPSFNEIRHILNLSQVLAIGTNLQLISFDGDQTLYADGGNFGYNSLLGESIIELIRMGVTVAVITAAGYGNDGSKYAIRLQGLLQNFAELGLTEEELDRFFIFGGECNYLLQAKAVGDGNERHVELVPVAIEEWQATHLVCQKPGQWPTEMVKTVLDTAEQAMSGSISQLRLRARIIRKERSIGIIPGGDEMLEKVPIGHGSKKLKAEALDETVFRVMESLRRCDSDITIPYCVFNGGRDAWVDIGNKSVAVKILQAWLRIDPSQCLHVGDQFLASGNDYAARETCPTCWIISPKETEKILEHVLKCKKGRNADHDIVSPFPKRPTLIRRFSEAEGPESVTPGGTAGGGGNDFNVYTG